MKACPACGQSGNGFRWKDHGRAFEYLAFFGAGDGTQEVTEITSTRPSPVWAKCSDCGHRVKIEEAIAKDE